MSFDAVLFDMDGVVIDTHEAVTRFWNTLAGQVGIALTEADYERDIYGVPAEATFDRLFPMLSATQRQQILVELMEDELTQRYVAVAGVIAFLHTLHAARIPAALVTSGDRWKVKQVFAQLALHPLFAEHVTVNDIRQGKPHPECYLLGAQRLGVDARRCLVFEDSVAGATAGVAAGATVIGVQPAQSMAQKVLAVGAVEIIPNFTTVSVKGQSLLICANDGRVVRTFDMAAR